MFLLKICSLCTGKEKMKKIKMTKRQYEYCQSYLNGNKTENDIYPIFKTYLDEYIVIYGWHSWQYDNIPKIVKNFCIAA